MAKTREEAKVSLQTALQSWRPALEDAQKDAQAKLGIVAEKPDGTGSFAMKFDPEDFMRDVERVASTEESAPDAVEARYGLSGALKYFRKAVVDAKKDGVAKLAVLAEKPDGGGRLVARFDCEQFFDDLALVLGAEPQTMQDDAEVMAHRFLQTHGLSVRHE